MKEHAEIIKHLANGGIIALRLWGTRTIVMDVATKPRSFIGIRRLGAAEEAGLVRRGDPSPYKNGTSTPYVLTDAGKAAAAELLHA